MVIENMIIIEQFDPITNHNFLSAFITFLHPPPCSTCSPPGHSMLLDFMTSSSSAFSSSTTSAAHHNSNNSGSLLSAGSWINLRPVIWEQPTPSGECVIVANPSLVLQKCAVILSQSLNLRIENAWADTQEQHFTFSGQSTSSSVNALLWYLFLVSIILCVNLI